MRESRALVCLHARAAMAPVVMEYRIYTQDLMRNIQNIYSQLNVFRLMEDQPSASYASMRAISVKLTDEEMKAVADYIQGLQ